MNWAVVVPASGMYVRLITNGVYLRLTNLSPGLNFGSPEGMQAGTQVLQMAKQGQPTFASCQGSGGVTASCPQGFYNFNYQVVGLQ